MANTMTGRVLLIGNVEEIPSKSGGEPFKKRVVVLNCTHSNYGDVYENYPSFEFSGKHVDDPADFAVGDSVRIITGAFVNQIGTVDSIDTHNRKVNVSVVMFGRKTLLELDLNCVESI